MNFSIPTTKSATSPPFWFHFDNLVSSYNGCPLCNCFIEIYELGIVCFTVANLPFSFYLWSSLRNYFKPCPLTLFPHFLTGVNHFCCHLPNCCLPIRHWKAKGYLEFPSRGRYPLGMKNNPWLLHLLNSNGNEFNLVRGQTLGLISARGLLNCVRTYHKSSQTILNFIYLCSFLDL